MIQLLSPDEVKKGPSKAVEEQRGIVRDLGAEESKLVLSINTLRQNESEEKARISKEVTDARKNADVEIGKINTELSAKKGELTILEARRAEALRPIEEIRKDADTRLEQVKVREDAVGKREAAADEKEEEITEAMERIADRRQEQDERDEKQEQHEKHLEAADDLQKKSAQELSGKWVAYHEAVATKNGEFEQRESKVAADTRANQIEKEELAKRAADYNEKDREIKHRYAILEISSAEIIRKQNSL